MSGQLVVVATPIGNLGDLSERALAQLELADVILCEDTRRTRELLSAKGLRGAGRLVALHDHNELDQCDDVVRRVSDGQHVVLVSDAGTPTVSDPGTKLVAAVAGAGLVVTTVPGPSAVLAALAVSGLATDRFCVEGFVPRRAGDRRARFDEWRHEARTIVCFESPRRIVATLRELAEVLGDRPAVVAREMTKMHEEVVRGTLSELATRWDDDVRGEVVLVIAGARDRAEPVDDDSLRRALSDEIARGRSTRDAAASVATALGASHRHVYALAVALREDPGE